MVHEGRALLLHEWSEEKEDAPSIDGLAELLASRERDMPLKHITFWAYFNNNPTIQSEVLAEFKTRYPDLLDAAFKSSGNMHNPKVLPLRSRFSECLLATPTLTKINAVLNEHGYSITKVSFEKFWIDKTSETMPFHAIIWLIPGAEIAAPKAFLKSEYEKIRDERNQAPTFAARKMDAKAADFLEVVKRDWELRSSESPDSAFSKIAGLTGFSNDVKGVVDFYTHKTPPYSKDDHQRNAKEAVIAATLTVSLPISVDSVLHAKGGLTYIKNSQTTATVFEDTEKGLKRTVYVKPARR